VLGGGRGPSDRVRLVPWGEERLPGADPDAPWPGRLPAPSPATVPAEPVAAEVLDASAAPVGVSGRQLLTGRPAAVSVAGGPARPVLAWAGPWAAEEFWWEPDGGRRRARLQVLLDGVEQTALLLVREGQGWAVEGVYD
jgi:protein ImuB